ncbi:MAG: hypothetical protein P8L32_03010, partial [Paracoccaceae bacterium]|nr:hypothetical protein [Paracoccaceae bacterium]
KLQRLVPSVPGAQAHRTLVNSMELADPISDLSLSVARRPIASSLEHFGELTSGALKPTRRTFADWRTMSNVSPSITRISDARSSRVFGLSPAVVSI